MCRKKRTSPKPEERFGWRMIQRQFEKQEEPLEKK